MNEQHNDHSDLDALLSGVPPEEADRLREVWEQTGDEEPTDYPDSVATEEALQHMRAVMEPRTSEQVSLQPSGNSTKRAADRGPDAHRRHTSRPKRVTWRGAAAFLAVLLAGALGFYWWQRPITRTAPLGEHLALTLPDGSYVELNSGSSIRYERRFGEERAIRLEGEAFFDVAKDARPFIVHTFNAEINVLGTRFNVRAWPDDLERSTLVTLVEGRVTFNPRGRPNHAVALEPGETRRVRRDAMQVDPAATLDVSTDDVTAWRRGDLVFKDRSFGDVLREVERRFAVDLEVQPPSLQQTRINLALRQPAGAEAVVRDLALALDLKYRETSTGYELYRAAL